MTRATFLVRHGAGFYFRFLGYGLSVSVAPHARPLFSERMGQRKFWYIGRYKLGWLRP